MNNYISNLIGRTQQTLPVVSPRPVSMFEDTYDTDVMGDESVAVTPETAATHSGNMVQQQTVVAYPNTPTTAQRPTLIDQEPSPRPAKQREAPLLPVQRDKRNGKPPLQPELPHYAKAKRPFPPIPTNTSETTLQPKTSNDERTSTKSPVLPDQTATVSTITANPKNNNDQTESAVLTTKSTPAVLAAQLPPSTRIQVTTPVLLTQSTPPIMSPLPGSPISRQQSETAVAATPAAQSGQAIIPIQQQNGKSLLPQTMPPIIPLRETAIAVQPTNHLQPSPLSNEEVPSSPTIQVKIGRIEVRASSPEPPPSTKKARGGSVLSLDEYLTQRQGGKS